MTPNGCHRAIVTNVKMLDDGSFQLHWRVRNFAWIVQIVAHEGLGEILHACGLESVKSEMGVLGFVCIIAVFDGTVTRVLPTPEREAQRPLNRKQRERVAAIALASRAIERPTWQNCLREFDLTPAGVRRAQKLADEWGRGR